MKTAIATIRGMSNYSQSRPYEVPKEPGEGFEDYERRTWRNRMHVDGAGNVFIPPMSFKNAIAEAAKFLSIGIPGKGKATYTKNFEAGLLIINPLVLPIKAEDVESERLFVPATGGRGGGRRVYKWFPLIREWGGEIELTVLDETILQSAVENPEKTVCQVVLERCGQFIGIGRFRPRNNGYYGRFAVEEFTVV